MYDAWDPMFMFVEAVKKANSLDPARISEALRAVRWPSVFGDMYVDLESVYKIKCTFCRPIPLGVIKNGKPVHLTTVPWPSDDLIAKLNAD